MNCNFCLLFNFFVSQKHIFLKALHGPLFIWILWVFLGLPNLKMTLASLNTSFHINLGRFVDD
jgi:hypothetical protein